MSVEDIQSALNQLGSQRRNFNVTGDYDQATKAAISAAFQQSHNCDVDGWGWVANDLGDPGFIGTESRAGYYERRGYSEGALNQLGSQSATGRHG